MTVDTQYRELLRYILKTGKFHDDPNRVGTRRLNIPSYYMGIPINSIPAVSIKKSFPSLAMKELALFMRGERDIRTYWKQGVHFWDKDWFKYSGYMANAELADIKDNPKNYETIEDIFNLGLIYPHQYRNFGYRVDQMERLLYKMIHRPMSSDLVVTAWSPSDEKLMTLKACHYTFIITMEKINYSGTYGFHLDFIMRSSDVFLGLPMNIMYYFFLGKILEKVTKHKMLSLNAQLYNVHLYDNSVEASKDVILNTPKHFHKLENLIFSNYLKEPVEDYKSFWDNLPYDAVKMSDYQSYRHYPVEMLEYS